MQTGATDAATGILRTTPMMKKANVGTEVDFNLGKDMAGMTSMKLSDQTKMTGMGKMVDINS